jgi:hypothetical protein
MDKATLRRSAPASLRYDQERYAGKWETVRAVESRKEREKAISALKAEQKKSCAEEATHQVSLRRPEKDAAWRAMLAQQEQERLDLRKGQREEVTALARQHIAERLGVHEKWRARHLDGQAGRIDAKLSAKQGMAAQQNAAVKSMNLHRRTGRIGNQQDIIPSANPREAAREYFAIAHKEQAKQEALRQKLLEYRKKNLERAGLMPDRNRTSDREAQSAGRGGNVATPRAVIAPGP